MSYTKFSEAKGFFIALAETGNETGKEVMENYNRIVEVKDEFTAARHLLASYKSYQKLISKQKEK